MAARCPTRHGIPHGMVFHAGGRVAGGRFAVPRRRRRVCRPLRFASARAGSRWTPAGAVSENSRENFIWVGLGLALSVPMGFTVASVVAVDRHRRQYEYCRWVKRCPPRSISRCGAIRACSRRTSRSGGSTGSIASTPSAYVSASPLTRVRCRHALSWHVRFACSARGRLIESRRVHQSQRQRWHGKLWGTTVPFS